MQATSSKEQFFRLTRDKVCQFSVTIPSEATKSLVGSVYPLKARSLGGVYHTSLSDLEKPGRGALLLGRYSTGYVVLAFSGNDNETYLDIWGYPGEEILSGNARTPLFLSQVGMSKKTESATRQKKGPRAEKIEDVDVFWHRYSSFKLNFGLKFARRLAEGDSCLCALLSITGMVMLMDCAPLVHEVIEAMKHGWENGLFAPGLDIPADIQVSITPPLCMPVEVQDASALCLTTGLLIVGTRTGIILCFETPDLAQNALLPLTEVNAESSTTLLPIYRSIPVYRPVAEVAAHVLSGGHVLIAAGSVVGGFLLFDLGCPGWQSDYLTFSNSDYCGQALIKVRGVPVWNGNTDSAFFASIQPDMVDGRYDDLVDDHPESDDLLRSVFLAYCGTSGVYRYFPAVIPTVTQSKVDSPISIAMLRGRDVYWTLAGTLTGEIILMRNDLVVKRSVKQTNRSDVSVTIAQLRPPEPREDDVDFQNSPPLATLIIGFRPQGKLKKGPSLTSSSTAWSAMDADENIAVCVSSYGAIAFFDFTESVFRG